MSGECHQSALNHAKNFGEVLTALERIISSWEEERRALKAQTEALEKELQQMRHLATRDPVTDLPNRRLLDESLRFAVGHARRHAEPLSLVLLDIDIFKTFNDTHGHLEGDRLLKQLGNLLYQLSRHESDVVARFGGDEFAVVLTSTPAAGARQMAERIQQTVKSALPCTVSIGIATLDEEMSDPSDLLRAADDALYRAKNKGRNCIVAFESAPTPK